MAAQLILANTGNICLLDEEDYLRVKSMFWYEWHTQRGNTNYARKKIDGVNVLLHRFVLACPDHLLVDHINGDGLDNRKENLRLATRSQNNFNSASSTSSTSAYKGVYWKSDRSKWGVKAKCSITGSAVHLGYYKCEREAALVYNRYCVRFNPFARLNIIKEGQ